MLQVEGLVIPPASCDHKSLAAAAAFSVGAGGVGFSKCERPKAAAEETVERAMPVTGKGREKKQKKRVTVDTTTRPFPVLTEEQLLRIEDPVEREEWRELMARAAKLYYECRERRASLASKGGLVATDK